MLSGQNPFKPSVLLLQKLDYDHFDKYFSGVGGLFATVFGAFINHAFV